MTLRSPDRPAQSAKDYYSHLFKPSYDTFLEAARQTPLVIMLWGPRRPSLAWSRMRLQTRNTLQQLGHTVYLSEQLGIPASASTQKAVEYLQRDAVDLTIAIQSSYGLVGTVSQFVEFRVIDSKMLLFIDAAAPDNYLYDRAVAELKNLYDSVETYQMPDDIVRDNLLRKILAKVSLMQTVKHRAIQRARGWSLRLENSEPANTPIAPLQPFRYNLLELYREHRDEIDAFNDLMRLFFLAYLNDAGRVSLKALSKDVGLAEHSLLQQIAPLLRSEMVSQADGILAATAYGRRMLDGLNLTVPPTPLPPVLQTPRVLPPILRTRLATLAAGAGLVLAAVLLFTLALINSVNPVQNQQPLVLTPLPPAITATATLIPVPSLTPAPPRR